jgi:hypothetical protein
VKIPGNFRGAERIEVLEVEVLEGDGAHVPLRVVTYYVHTSGTVLAWHDPLEERQMPHTTTGERP